MSLLLLPPHCVTQVERRRRGDAILLVHVPLHGNGSERQWPRPTLFITCSLSFIKMRLSQNTYQLDRLFHLLQCWPAYSSLLLPIPIHPTNNHDHHHWVCPLLLLNNSTRYRNKYFTWNQSASGITNEERERVAHKQKAVSTFKIFAERIVVSQRENSIDFFLHLHIFCIINCLKCITSDENGCRVIKAGKS